MKPETGCENVNVVFNSTYLDQVAFLFADDATDVFVNALLEFGPYDFSPVTRGENDVVGEF